MDPARMKAFLLGFSMATEKHKSYIAMVFIQFVYTGMALLSKAAISEGMKFSVFATYRQGLAFLALAPFAFFLESNKSAPLSYCLLCKIFFVSLGITMSLNLYFFALNYISATFATASTNTIPVMVFIMAVALRMEKVSLRQWHGRAKVLGSVMGLSGAMVFTFLKGPPIYSGNEHKKFHNISTNGISKEDWIKGALLLLAANLSWSSWLICQAPIVKQYPAKLRLTTLQCFFSCLQSGIWAAAMERNISSWKLGWDINLLSVAYCGIVVTGITYWLQVWVVERKGSVFTSIFSPLALILTAIFSALIFKETFYWGSVLGAILLVGGLYSYLWGKNKEQRSETKETQKIETKEDNLEEMESISSQH